MSFIANLTVVPGATKTFAANGNTLANFLDAADVPDGEYSYYVNGQPADLDTEVPEGGDIRVHRTPTTIKVTVGKLPGLVQKYTLNGDRSILSAINAAELSTDGATVRVNGNPVSDFNAALNDGDKVFLTENIEGN